MPWCRGVHVVGHAEDGADQVEGEGGGEVRDVRLQGADAAGQEGAVDQVAQPGVLGRVAVHEMPVQPVRPGTVAGDQVRVLAQPPVAQEAVHVVVAGDVPDGRSAGLVLREGRGVVPQPAEVRVRVTGPAADEVGRRRRCEGHGRGGAFRCEEIEQGRTTSPSRGSGAEADDILLGCQWRCLPYDFPPYTAVYYYFGKWRDDGTDQVIHDLLRRQVCERHGRHEDPSAIVMDSQTVHTSGNAPKATTGLDPGKKSRAASGAHRHRHPGSAHRGDRGCGERARQRHRHHAAGPGRRGQPVGDQALGGRRVQERGH